MSIFIEVGPTPSSLAPVTPTPSACSWGLQDISSEEAGRVHDADNTMYKMRTSQKRKLTLAWTNISDVEASRILQMFNDEYFYVRFPDLLTGTRITRRFYAGDRTGAFRWYDLPLKGTVLGTLSFDVIER